MTSTDAPKSETAELIVEAAQRIGAAVDSAEPSHQRICLLMTQQMSGTASQDDIMELVELLQYFDRLQQRTHALRGLIETVACERESVSDAIALFCATAPVEDDAQWLAQRYPQCDEIDGDFDDVVYR